MITDGSYCIFSYCVILNEIDSRHYGLPTLENFRIFIIQHVLDYEILPKYS